MRRVTDFGEVIFVDDTAWWTSGQYPVPGRLLDAIRCGEATYGGLAELGWRPLDYRPLAAGERQ